MAEHDNIRSMTGFGTARAGSEGPSATVEIKTVNHRYLKLSLRLPGDHAALEAEVESRVKKALRRGSVHLVVRLEGSEDAASIGLDTERLAQLDGELDGLARRLQIDRSNSEERLRTLLQVPGALSGPPAPSEEAIASERDRVLAAVDEALIALDRSRTREGTDMVQSLRAPLAALRTQLAVVVERAPAVPAAMRERMRQRVEKLLEDVAPGTVLADSDLLREIVIIADRCDVTEEIDRLTSHLDRFDEILAEGGEVGRKLDFLCQEILREINTTGSKANDETITMAVVEMKIEVERLKEQVQNLE